MSREVEIVEELMGDEGWYRGFPENLVELANRLHELGMTWDEIEEILKDIVHTVRKEYQ